MRKLNRIMILVGFLIPSLLKAESKLVSPKPADLPTYTLIDTVVITTYNGLKCELAVAFSNDHKDIHIVRLDLRKGIYSVNYFAKKPDLFFKHGTKHILADELTLNGQAVAEVNSKIDFDQNHKDVVLKVRLANDQILEKKIDIESDFFKDNPSQCLN